MSLFKILFLGIALWGAQNTAASAAPSEITIAVDIDRNAGFSLFFTKGAIDIILDRKKYAPKWQKRANGNVRVVTVPYTLVKGADSFCVWLDKGWIVHDQNGAAFAVSCDKFRSSDWTSKTKGPVYSMNVKRGNPD